MVMPVKQKPGKWIFLFSADKKGTGRLRLSRSSAGPMIQMYLSFVVVLTALFSQISFQFLP